MDQGGSIARFATEFINGGDDARRIEMPLDE